MSNRLSKENSPYLKQHQDHPVDWYPWGPEALNRAKSENKPILLSIGYSACHWCHVMAHESFENSEVAQLMNKDFINIKVDREERPDLDQIYQNVAQLFTQGGGWPLTVFLTPDLKPYFGGTYFPPEDRFGRPGFPRLLASMARAYQEDRDVVETNADRITQSISQLESISKSTEGAEQRAEIDSEIFRTAARKICSQVDWKNGGLGGAPKFPSPMTFAFLWRTGLAHRDSELKAAVNLTLVRMATRGVYDQLGGGFHRYSVDEHWNVPHFEKMLYDNALLLKLYSEVLLTAQAGGELSEEHQTLFLNTVEQTVEYVLREMTSPEGGFFAAQDADSEGEEGVFFVWSPSELQEILTPLEVQVFSARFGVTDHGNFEHSKTVLFQNREIGRIAAELGLSEDQATAELKSAIAKVWAKRETRVRPGLDHKILVSWNGLMISGLIWSAQALEKLGRTESSVKAARAARTAFEWVAKNSRMGQGRLSATTQAGRPKLNGYLDDYAFMAQAALDLSRFEGDPLPDLKRSKEWIDSLIRHFIDPREVGYFFTSDDHEILLQRPKSIHDQAIPSGTAVALQCMIAHTEIGTGNYTQEIEYQLTELLAIAADQSYASSEILSTGLFLQMGPVVTSGDWFGSDFAHPHLVRKPGFESTVCHQGTCSMPYPTREEFGSGVQSKLQLQLS